MPYIKRVNEKEEKSYDTEPDIHQLVNYVMNPLKTSFDSVRPGHMLGDFAGASPMLASSSQMLNPGIVSEIMVINDRCYNKTKSNLMKHRIISFSRYDQILPNEALRLAEWIARNIYYKYITAYGVHVDTSNIHIHFAVNTIGWEDGKRFSLYHEEDALRSAVWSWEKAQDQYLIANPQINARHQKYYGDY